MLRLALKSVRHNPKRLILTAIAVMLGVSLVATTFIFTNSLSTGFKSLFNEIFSSVDVVVQEDPEADMSRPFTELPFTAELLDQIRALPEVAIAEGGVGVENGFLLNEDRSGAFNPGGAPTLVYNWTGVQDIDRSVVEEGRAPSAPGEIAVDIDTAKNLDLGDTLAIATDRGISEYTLVGTVRFGESNSLQTANLAYLIESEVRELGGGLTGYAVIEVLAAEGNDPTDVAELIGTILPESTRAITGEELAMEQSAAFDEFLQYINIFVVAFAFIALFVGAYIIVNTFRTIVTQRTREFGLLRAIGVSGSQVRNMIVLEAVIVGIIASTLGLLGGWVLALGIVFALETLVTGEMFGSVTIPPQAILMGYGLGVLVTLVSALLPAIHASRISPMEALRESATQSKKPLTQRTIVGSTLTALGILSITVGLVTDAASPYWYVAAGAAALLIGVTLLAAHLLLPVAAYLRTLANSSDSVAPKLAVENIRREPRRSANAAAALMIGVMLLALVATFTESMKSTFTDQFVNNEADLFILANTTLIPQGALDIIADVDGVETVARIGFGEVTVDDVPRSLGLIDAIALESLFELPTDRPMSEMGDGAFIDLAMQNAGFAVGDVLTVAGDRQTLELEVTGLYTIEGDANVFVDWEVGSQLVYEPIIVQALIGFEDGVDVDATRELVEERLAADYPLLEVSSPSELEDFFNQIIDFFLGVISALLASALVIAILGVANTLLLSVTERTREIGLLRAVGLRRKQVSVMIVIESMILAVFGTVLGMVLGVSLGVALVESLGSFGFSGATIPWMWLIIYTVLAAFAGVLAAIWPAFRASRLDILKAIATE